MSKCKTCQVQILDETLICPLCNSVLETGISKIDKHQLAMYPNVKAAARKLNFIIKLYIFSAIVIEIMLIIINYQTFNGVRWSAITAVGILYFYITLQYSVRKNGGIKYVLSIQIIAAVIMTICIDFVIGYRGWSLNYVLPSSILLLNLAVIVLMLINSKNWQSYILLQLLNVIFSIVVFIFWWVGVIQFPILTIAAVAVSSLFFIGTLIFGDRKAKNELKRRFHV
jgi:hypothetical protein